MNDFLQFRFVPTMKCNLKCSYCFLKHSTGDEPTMFDKIPPSIWVEAMKKFSNYDVEFYMWGGEPFCIDGTFDLVKGFAEYDFVKWARIDSNLTYAKKIAERCPSEKIKVLCSWHTESVDFDQYWKLINYIHVKNMVGMVNFVASDSNMNYLRKNSFILNELIKRFEDIGIFLNVAADFNKGEDQDYKYFITQYMTVEDWDHIHGHYPSKNVLCDASQHFFTIDHDGTITSCGMQQRRFLSREYRAIKVGDFLDGVLNKKRQTRCPVNDCKCIISYHHRLDNSFNPRRHLEDYIERNSVYRKSTIK